MAASLQLSTQYGPPDKTLVAEHAASAHSWAAVLLRTGQEVRVNPLIEVVPPVARGRGEAPPWVAG
jgi:hypothetical protein